MSFLKKDNRRAIRMENNPYDKSTIVSIFPKRIEEKKYTIQPGHFVIEPGTYDKPSILVIGSSSWWRDIDPDQPLLELSNSSPVVAKSVVDDFCNALLGSESEGCRPGLFWVPGEFTVEKLKIEKKALLDKARAAQNTYWKRLVELSDMLWARSNNNPLAISDDARLAANELGLKDKPWLGTFNAIQLSNCPACGELRDSNFPICRHCRTVVDPVKFKELNLKQAAS